MPECWSLFFNKVAVKFTGKHLQAPASETNSLCLHGNIIIHMVFILHPFTFWKNQIQHLIEIVAL